MEREHPEHNLIWLPETITNCQHLEASGGATTIGIIDLVTREYIILDMDLKGNTTRGNTKEIIELINEYAQPSKVSVYDLLLLHTEARGRQMTLDSNIDTYFKVEDFMTSYEKTAQYML
jgi:hypothetical protein